MLAGVRYGAIAGVIAFATTLAANLAILVFSPADLCRMGPLNLLLFNLGALLVFLVLAGVAGFLAGRAGGTVPAAALAGVMVGAISGCALLVLIPYGPALMQRLTELNALCPGGTISFGPGASPPPGVTPPPGAFPPAGSFGTPTGPAGLVLEVIGLVFGIAVGTGFATGAAALGGLVGVATRPRPAAG
jgi:hypothetical protein